MKNWEKYLEEVIEDIQDRDDLEYAEAKLIAGANAETVRGCFEREMTSEQCVNLINGQADY